MTTAHRTPKNARKTTTNGHRTLNVAPKHLIWQSFNWDIVSFVTLHNVDTDLQPRSDPGAFPQPGQSRAPTAYLAIYLDQAVVWESFRLLGLTIFCQA